MIKTRTRIIWLLQFYPALIGKKYKNDCALLSAYFVTCLWVTSALVCSCLLRGTDVDLHVKWSLWNAVSSGAITWLLYFANALKQMLLVYCHNQFYTLSIFMAFPWSSQWMDLRPVFHAPELAVGWLWKPFLALMRPVRGSRDGFRELMFPIFSCLMTI